MQSRRELGGGEEKPWPWHILAVLAHRNLSVILGAQWQLGCLSEHSWPAESSLMDSRSVQFWPCWTADGERWAVCSGQRGGYCSRVHPEHAIHYTGTEWGLRCFLLPPFFLSCLSHPPDLFLTMVCRDGIAQRPSPFPSLSPSPSHRAQKQLPPLLPLFISLAPLSRERMISF